MWEIKNKGDIFLLEEQHENIVVTVTKWEMGNSRKYPYPTTDGFHVLTPPPPCLWKFQNASEFHNREPPLPFRISWFFWKYIFDLATPIWTNKHEFMPPQGCDLAAPGDKLYSSATRKTYRYWPGCANSFLSPNLAIKINITYVNFTPLCFLVLFWHLQSKIAALKFRLLKSFGGQIYRWVLLRPFICHVVYIHTYRYIHT